MTNHTPGPWKYRQLYADGNIITEGDYWEIFTYEYDVAAFFSRGAPIRKEADARLIAAAPELLEALRNAIEYFEGDYMRPDWLDAAEHAVARAMRGEMSK